MLRPRPDPLPVEAVRDLIGIARIMWRATAEDDQRRRRQIASGGRKLRRALAMALQHPPSSEKHSEAWRWAEEGCRELGEAISYFEKATVWVQVATRAVVNGGEPAPRPRPPKPRR
ncbi:MAG: hypothetical protein HOW73_45435 [Polyangiaceae bacterium]|nr:hypothetical protein [Polyangiaceae bacterium]